MLAHPVYHMRERRLRAAGQRQKIADDELRDRAAATGITYEQATHDMLAEKQPMSKFSTPEQIGGLAVFLCSDAAATITGAPMSIDGGWVAQ